MAEQNFVTPLKQLAAVKEELKVLAIALSSVRVIDPHEMSKELNDHLAKIRPFLLETHMLSSKENDLLEEINHLAQTCLKMAEVRQRFENGDFNGQDPTQ